MDTPVVQPVPPPPKNNSGILIGILLFLLGILVGLALGKTSIISGLRLPYLTAAPTPTSIPTPTPTPDPTANWKTYTNSQYGFSFKYPTNLSTLTEAEGTISGLFSGNPLHISTLADKTTMAQGTGKPFDGIGVDLITTGGSFDTYVSNEVKTEKQSPRGIFNETINIPAGNLHAFYIDSEEAIRRYFVKLPNNRALVFSVSHSTPMFLTIFDQILSTFKFVDQTTDTTNWKTYTNSFYSIKYPNVWTIADNTDTFVEFVKTNGLFDTVTQKNTSLTISASPKSLNYAGCPNPYDSTHTLIIGGEQLILGVQKQKEDYIGSVTDTATRCWFAKNNIIYGIHFYSKDDVSEEITQILSTFRFTQ